MVNFYLNKNNLSILNKNIIRKGYDLEFETSLNSTIGSLNIYTKARNKKKINDKDLSLILNLSNEKKSPILFLTNGELTKKASKYLAQNKNLILFRNIYDRQGK